MNEDPENLTDTLRYKCAMASGLPTYFPSHEGFNWDKVDYPCFLEPSDRVRYHQFWTAPHTDPLPWEPTVYGPAFGHILNRLSRQEFWTFTLTAHAGRYLAAMAHDAGTVLRYESGSAPIAVCNLLLEFAVAQANVRAYNTRDVDCLISHLERLEQKAEGLHLPGLRSALDEVAEARRLLKKT